MSYRDEQAKCATESRDTQIGGAAGYAESTSAGPSSCGGQRVIHTVADFLRIRQLALRDQIRIAQEKLTTVELLLNVLQDGPCR